VDLPVLGVGGVASARDAVEYLMAGATLVGVCTAGHMNGAGRYAKILRELAVLLGQLGYRGPGEARGLALDRIRQRREGGRQAVTVPVRAAPTARSGWRRAAGRGWSPAAASAAGCA